MATLLISAGIYAIATRTAAGRSSSESTAAPTLSTVTLRAQNLAQSLGTLVEHAVPLQERERLAEALAQVTKVVEQLNQTPRLRQLLRPADHRGSLDRVTVALDAIEANIEYLVASPLDDAVPSSPAASLVTVDSETVRSSIAAAALAAASEPGMAIGAKNGRRIVRATWHTGVPVAIKRLETLSDMSDPIMVDDVKREAEVWSSLQPHPNLTPLLAICIDTDIPVLVMPYMTNGNVASYAQLHPTKRHGLIADAARGMAYLHALGIFHGDLKPSNVLVDGQGCARVSDLGLARMHASVRSSAVATGVRWIAPERLRAGAKFRLEPDVFAFAMVVFEVVSGHEPFDEVQDPRVIRGMMADGERPSLDLVVQDHWRTLISRCWAHEPRLRPTFQTICDELDQFQSIQPSS